MKAQRVSGAIGAFFVADFEGIGPIPRNTVNLFIAEAEN